VNLGKKSYARYNPHAMKLSSQYSWYVWYLSLIYQLIEKLHQYSACITAKLPGHLPDELVNLVFISNLPF
jgi:hypothetical protein